MSSLTMETWVEVSVSTHEPSQSELGNIGEVLNQTKSEYFYNYDNIKYVMVRLKLTLFYYT